MSSPLRFNRLTLCFVSLLIAFGFVAGLAGWLSAPVAWASSSGTGITINTPLDEYGTGAECSLREAIQAANTDAAFGGCSAGFGEDLIDIPAGIYTLTLAGANEDANATGDLDITSTLMLVGADMATTIIDANGLDRALNLTTTASLTLTLSNVTVQNGIAPNANGGGLLVFQNAATFISHTTFFSNTALNGGGVYVESLSTVILVTNTTFLSNTATGVSNSSGGGGYFQRGRVTDSFFMGNTATTSGGGAYFFIGPSITGTTFSGNSATTSGGGLYVFAGVTTVTGTTFLNNTAQIGGGARFGGANLRATIFTGNSATTSGGGAHFETPATVLSTTFTNNTAYSGGGAQFQSSATVTDTTFASNAATSVGGGAYFQNPPTLNGTTFMSNTVTGVSGLGQGGGAYFSSDPTLTNTTFTGNTALHGGGGAYAAAGLARVANSAFARNVTTGTLSSDGGGGAYFAATALVTSTTFNQNLAPLGGGAYFALTATVTGTTFISNTATGSGGGLYVSGAGAVTNTTVSGNLASLNGGGAYFLTGPARLAGATFFSNTAGSSGGGAMLYGYTLANVTATAFLSNTATSGGGLYIFGNLAVTDTTFIGNRATLFGGGGVGVQDIAVAATVNFVNTLFAGNASANEQGAALFATLNSGGAEVTLRHITIVSPTVGSGSAVYWPASTLNITNSIVASYSVGLESTGTLNEDYNLFSGVATPYIGPVVSGGNSLTGTAAFADTTLYKLGDASVAIDAGTDVGITTDFEGEARPNGAGFDMGWDELVAVAISDLNASNDSPTVLGSATNFAATISAGTGVTYTWNFGDNSPLSNLPSPTHTYAITGTYTAIVTATNSLGSVSASTNVTLTNAAPDANAGSDQNAGLNTTVTLNGAASTDPDGHLPLTYHWTQSGGAPVTLNNASVVSPTFTAPATPAVLTFTLVVTDSTGLADATPDEVAITVSEIAISNLNASNSGPTRLTDATSFTATIGAGSNVSYQWNFGDNSSISNLPSPTHTYAAIGTYTAIVTATNSVNSLNVSTLVTITNAAPNADAGNDQNVGLNTTVTLNGSASTDPDGHTPLAYRWTQSGGPAVTLTTVNAVSPTFTAPATPTVLTFTLVVTDATGLADATPDEVVVTVSEIAIAGLSASNSSPMQAGNVTTFTATVSAGSNVSYEWNFGDGQLGSGISLTHTYATIGNYTAIVTATNSLSNVSASTSVTITPAGFKLYLPLITKAPSAAANLPTKSEAQELGHVAWRSER